MKTGKLPRRLDARTLRLGAYLPELPAVPPACDWTMGAREGWPLYRNNLVGDCTVAAAAHLVHAWSAAAGAETVVPERAVLEVYGAVSGYDPARPASDVGAYELDVLKHWKKHGLDGHRIGAYAAIDDNNLDHVRAAVALFGGCYAGLQLPEAARGRAVWDVLPTWARSDVAPGSWGPHAITLLAYAERGLLGVSWGELRWMTWGFFAAYADEAYAILSPDFVTGALGANGIDLVQLQADLAKIAASPTP